jgi:hypothetical protein
LRRGDDAARADSEAVRASRRKNLNIIHKET